VDLPGVPDPAERMSALLNRAVEEQVAEQRALASLLGEVRVRLEALDGVRAVLDDVRGELAELRSGLAGLASREAVEELRDGVAGIRTDLHQLPQQLGGVVAGRVGEPLEGLRVAIRESSATVEQVAADVRPLADEATASGVALDRLRRLIEEATTGDAPSTDIPDSHAVAAVVAPAVADAVVAALAAGLTTALTAELGAQLAAAVDRGSAGTAATEMRLRTHVDEAVLALAELLLARPWHA